MGDYEDYVHAAIKKKYGSIPKMAKATGIATTTIYHALDRGMKNTRTETSGKIEEAVFGVSPTAFNSIELDINQLEQYAMKLSEKNAGDWIKHLASTATHEAENKLIDFYRSMTDEGRERLLEQAELLAGKYPRDKAAEKVS